MVNKIVRRTRISRFVWFTVVLSLASLSVGVAEALAPGDLLWERRFAGPGVANSIAVSPFGARVFVTGSTTPTTIGDPSDYGTVSYDTAAGAIFWIKLYGGPGGGADSAASDVVSPDGTKVFVTGGSTGSGTGLDYATVAYDASLGTRLWVKRYNGPGNGEDSAVAVGASPDGSKVFVTGRSTGSGSDLDYATLAYDASTGAKLWVQRYDGPESLVDFASSIAVSADGTTVFVTGSSTSTNGYDFATVAHDASTGTRLWVRRYDGPAKGDDGATSIGVGPNGSVFVTGNSFGSGGGTGFATIAYETSTGATTWLRRFERPDHEGDLPSSLGVSPDGTRVFVTGTSYDPAGTSNYTTIAYGASTGATLWRKGYNGPPNQSDNALDLAVSPDSSQVFVTGESTGSSNTYDYATLAYDASTGTLLWKTRYNGPGNGDDSARSIVAYPFGTKVFITGSSIGPELNADYETIAYSA